LENLKTVYTAAVDQGGADELVIVDTVGIASPDAIAYLTKKVKSWVDVPIQVHLHNDFGLGTACSIAAVKAGASCIHLTVNGIGERTGMADLAEVAMSLYLLYGIDLGLDYERLRGVSELVEELSQYRMSPLKPIVGKGVFTREAGPVVAQLYREMPEAVEPFAPELVGSKREVVLGKKSGKYSIIWKLEEHGLEATNEQIGEILSKVKSLSENKRRYLTEDEIEEIMKTVIK
jgi:isopropylmalate/homocitrate/citramalate synthase